MTQRIKPFFLTQRIELFLWIWRKELNPFSSNMTQSIEPFFFEYDAKYWTLFLRLWRKVLNPFSLNMTQRIELFICRKELSLFLNMTQRIDPFSKIWHKEFNHFCNVTQRTELFFSDMTVAVTHPNGVSTRVNLAPRTRTWGGCRNPGKKNLSMMWKACQGRMCDQALLNDRWYLLVNDKNLARCVLPWIHKFKDDQILRAYSHGQNCHRVRPSSTSSMLRTLFRSPQTWSSHLWRQDAIPPSFFVSTPIRRTPWAVAWHVPPRSHTSCRGNRRSICSGRLCCSCQCQSLSCSRRSPSSRRPSSTSSIVRTLFRVLQAWSSHLWRQDAIPPSFFVSTPIRRTPWAGARHSPPRSRTYCIGNRRSICSGGLCCSLQCGRTSVDALFLESCAWSSECSCRRRFNEEVQLCHSLLQKCDRHVADLVEGVGWIRSKSKYHELDAWACVVRAKTKHSELRSCTSVEWVCCWLFMNLSSFHFL